MVMTPPPARPPATSRDVGMLAALWYELRTRPPAERVGFLHVALVSAETRSFAAAASALIGAAGPALPPAGAHAAAAAGVLFVDVFGEGDAAVRRLQEAWDAVSADLLPPLPAEAPPAARPSASSRSRLGRLAGRARLPVLAGVRPTLPLDASYRALPPDAQLVLLAVAGETGYAPGIWEPDVVAIRTGPLTAAATEAGIAALAAGGWIARSDEGGGTAADGWVLRVNARVLLRAADGPWGGRTTRGRPLLLRR